MEARSGSDRSLSGECRTKYRAIWGMSVKENTEEQQLSSGRVTNLLTEKVP
jgi:hypothetical protein